MKSKLSRLFIPLQSLILIGILFVSNSAEARSLNRSKKLSRNKDTKISHCLKDAQQFCANKNKIKDPLKECLKRNLNKLQPNCRKQLQKISKN